MTNLTLYLLKLITEGYEIHFYESKSYSEVMTIKVIKDPYKIIHLITKYDISNDEELITIIQNMINELDKNGDNT